VKQKHPDAEFLVTRRFHNASQEQAMLDKLDSPEYKDVITFIPNVGGKELPKVVRNAGIGLSVDQPTRIGLTSQPTKTFEYMSQALPIVASDLPNTRKHIEAIGCGVLVKPDDPAAYAEEIVKFLEDPDLARKTGEIGQKAFKEKLNWSVVEKKLVEFYQEITKK
jgi:glycosyltransferase involved in cell wall biosynthesis